MDTEGSMINTVLLAMAVALTILIVLRKLLDIKLMALENELAAIASGEYSFIDKSSWGDGPWQSEPDRVVWTDADTGLPCIINRHYSGTWLGYVGVPDGHEMHNADVDDVSLDAHGGVEFSGVPLTNQSDMAGLGHLHNFYWFGFSCAQWDDYLPGRPAYRRMSNHVVAVIADYKNVEYVKAECRKLAAQLGAI